MDELASLKHLKQYLASSKHSVLAAIITVVSAERLRKVT